MNFRCAGPNLQHHLPRSVPTYLHLGKEFNPAIADCRLQGTATSPSSTVMAERGGFEPPIRVLSVYAISSRAPSTSSAISPCADYYIIYILLSYVKVRFVRNICNKLTKGYRNLLLTYLKCFNFDSTTFSATSNNSFISSDAKL
ncbi:MAG: hypothetical protein JG776_2100 [Caloramator sp.]|nr:hypothetical protein [Caloramator sp.]